MKVHVVQFDIAWEEPDRNFEAVLQLLDRAEVSRGDLIVLPEMFDTGFSFNVDRTNDKAGRTLGFLCELADDIGVTVQGGRTIAACGRCAAKNVMSVAAPGNKVLAEYVKIHPFQREAERFEGGHELVLYEWNQLQVCPAICYDLRFPELFRLGLMKGAQAFAIGACWPSVRAHHWRALLIARAIENQAFVFAANRTGSDPMLKYAGGSMVIGPRGEVLGELKEESAVLSVAIDPGDLQAWRGAFGAWKDARLLNRVMVGAQQSTTADGAA